MPPKGQDKYTDPELREEVKEEIKAGDKGGQPGQWSARKAQFMASEYKKRGGGYTTDKKDESQKHIQQWNDEEWQTRDGSGRAKQEDGTEKRYLPKKAWDNMTEEEKDETEKAKEEGSKAGEQYVANTAKAAKERGKASKAAEDEGKEDEKDEEDEQGEQDTKGKKAATPKKSPAKSKSTKGSKAEDKEDKQVAKPAHAGQKRNTRSSGPAEEPASSPPSAKKQKTNSGSASKASTKKSDESKTSKKDEESSPKKSPTKSASTSKKTHTSKSGNDDGTVGTKHDPAEPPAPAGSADRLPKEGQTVHWKSFAGYIEGEVVEVRNEGSEKDVRIVLKSSKSGKEAVHKPEACFY